MKKLQQTLMVGALLVAPLLVGTTASAAGTCQIGYTGPDSNNLCVSTTTYECTITNNNTVTVTNDNTQVSVSGEASTGGNTSGGGAQSGSATNSNGVTFNATVKNGTCTVVASIPATPASTVTPAVTTPAVKQAVPAPAKPAAPVLANTAGDITTGFVAGLLGVTALGLVTLRVALASYARRHL